MNSKADRRTDNYEKPEYANAFFRYCRLFQTPVQDKKLHGYKTTETFENDDQLLQTVSKYKKAGIPRGDSP